MSDADFTALLKKNVSEIKRPFVLPSGTYTLQVTGYEFGKSSQKQTPYCRYKFVPIAFDQDVDPADLEGQDWMKKELREDYYLTENAMYRLADFLNTAGVNTEGRLMDELVPEAVGKIVKAAVGIQPNTKDPSQPGFNNINSIIKAE